MSRARREINRGCKLDLAPPLSSPVHRPCITVSAFVLATQKQPLTSPSACLTSRAKSDSPPR